MHIPFAKKTMAMAVLAVTAPLAFAQQAPAVSSVQLYGIVDVAYRHTNNEGPTADGSLSQMIGGGMSQSRWGININEELGGGLKAIANLENRFTADNGVPTTPYFQQSWLGLQGGFGRITMGRQYNMLFDLVTSTYASFPYSPYMEAYKPELGMAMGARANNSIKYLAELGDFRGALQYSFDEGNTVDKLGANVNPAGAIRTAGGYLRYATGGLAAGVGYLNTRLPGGTNVDAWTLGGSYRTGPWYFALGYGQNKRKDAYGFNTAGVVDSAIMSAYWSGSSNGGFLQGAPVNPANPASVLNLRDQADKRQMYKLGVGYQATSQLNIGVHYFHATQSGSVSGAYSGKADFLVSVLDYALSKRTDAYFALDYTRVNGGAGMALDSNGARNRTGVTVGMRHRF